MVRMLFVGHNFSRLPESMSSRVRIMDLSWKALRGNSLRNCGCARGCECAYVKVASRMHVPPRERMHMADVAISAGSKVV